MSTIVIIKCESGRHLAYYQHRPDIIANGDTVTEANENLVALYKSVLSYESPSPQPEVKTDTAMQMLIKQLKETRKQCIPEFIDGVDYAILEASSFFEVERSNIIDAVTYGNRQESYDGTETLGEKYFENKYNQ